MLYNGVDLLILAKLIKDDVGGYEASTPVEFPVASVDTGNEGSVTPVYKDGNIINFYPVGAESDVTIETQAISPDLLSAFFYGEEGAEAFIDTGTPQTNYYTLGFRFALTDGSYTYYSYPKGTIIVNSKAVKSNDGTATAVVESIIFKPMPTVHKFAYNDKPCRKLIINTNNHEVHPEGFKAMVWTPDNLLPVPEPILTITEEAGAPYVMARAIRAGDTVRATTDGTTPTVETEPVIEPIAVNATMTIKAVECSTCLHTSAVTTLNVADYVLLAPDANVLYGDGVSFVELSAPHEADVRYTLDGSIPTIASDLYSETIQLRHNTILKARAFKEGFVSSETIEYNIKVALASPALTCIGADAQPNTGFISFSNEYDDSVTVRYTLDGTEPTEESPILTTATMTGEQTLKAIAFSGDSLNEPSNLVVFEGEEHMARDPVIGFEITEETYRNYVSLSYASEEGTIWTKDNETGVWTEGIIEGTYHNVNLIVYAERTGCINSKALILPVDVQLKAPALELVSTAENCNTYAFSLEHFGDHKDDATAIVTVSESDFPFTTSKDESNMYINVYGNGTIRARLESAYNTPSDYVEITASGLKAIAPVISVG